MCKRADASCEPAPTLTGTGTGTPSFIVSSLLRLAQTVAAEIWRHMTTDRIIRIALEWLDEAREDFESMKYTRDINDSLPLSEGLEKYLETFSDNYDR